MITAIPKPAKREKKPAKPVKKRNIKRHSREWLRAYGSRERVEWVKSLPCCACGKIGFSECAHIRAGGMGRKSDAGFTVPLCGHLAGLIKNCHSDIHTMGVWSWQESRGINLEDEAAATERRWLAYTQQETL